MKTKVMIVFLLTFIIILLLVTKAYSLFQCSLEQLPVSGLYKDDVIFPPSSSREERYQDNKKVTGIRNHVVNCLALQPV